LRKKKSELENYLLWYLEASKNWQLERQGFEIFKNVENQHSIPKTVCVFIFAK
jgi:hypothetical protein